MSKAEYLIKKHEGLRLNPYNDSVGVLTVGYGHNLEVPITQAQANEYLEKDMFSSLECCNAYPWYKDLSENRQAVIQDMMFNLGAARFSGFRKTIALIKNGDYDLASDEMLNSKWATQVGKRADELSRIMKTDTF